MAKIGSQSVKKNLSLKKVVLLQLKITQKAMLYRWMLLRVMVFYDDIKSALKMLEDYGLGTTNYRGNPFL